MKKYLQNNCYDYHRSHYNFVAIYFHCHCPPHTTALEPTSGVNCGDELKTTPPGINRPTVSPRTPKAACAALTGT